MEKIPLNGLDGRSVVGENHEKVGISDGVDVLKSATCPRIGLNVV